MRYFVASRFAYRPFIPEVTVLIASFSSAVAYAQTDGPPPEPPAAAVGVDAAAGDANQDLEVLTRGPLHEAFAAPVANDPEPADLVQEAPPEPIEELPPEVQPEGENVQWIPGYWAWDEQEKRYIWISGVWRDVPPGREWVPGYWADDAGGHRWVSGFWGVAAPPGTQVVQDVYDAARQAQAYFAPPPESLEAGPTSPQPSDQHFWIPGCWIAGDAGYRWRPGYWYGYVPNWVWVPDNYVWTPAGCVFVPGYWDYTLASRGLCFAPVHFNRVVYRRPQFFYRPSFALDISNVALHLWAHPRHRYYCYGDYYGATYASFGYRPWFQLAIGFGGGRPWCYDPLLTYYGTHFHRHGIGYVDRLRGWHRYYDHHHHHRPPRTFAHQQELDFRNDLRGARKQVVLARPIDEVRRDRPAGGRRVVAIDRADRDRQSRQVQAARDVARARRDLEAIERNGDDGLARRGGNPRQVVTPGGRGGQVRDDTVAQQESREQFRAARERARELARNDAEPNGSVGNGRQTVVRNRTSGAQQPQITTGEQLRQAIDRARQSARNSQNSQVDAARRRAAAAQSRQNRLGREPDVVRGQSQPRVIERNNSPLDSRIQSREPIRIDRNRAAADAASRAREAINARRTQDALNAQRAQAAENMRRAQQSAESARRSQEAAANAQRARDAANNARRDQEAIQSQQRQRSIQQSRDAARQAIERARSQAQQRARATSSAPVQRQFAPPAGSIQRSQPSRIAPRQIERRAGPTRAAQPSPRVNAQARQRVDAARSRANAARSRAAAPRRQIQRPSAAPAQRSKPTTIRPSGKARLWRGGSGAAGK